MNSKIAIYESHEKALEAVYDLQKAGFPVNKVSLIGEAQIIDNHIYLKSLDTAKTLPIAVGASLGLVTGLLSGIGLFTIPGFGFLYGAGAIIGAIAGFDLGIIGGGLTSVLVHIGIKKEEVIKYEEHIRAGRFVLLVKGSEEEVHLAEKILQKNNIPFLLS